MSKSVEKSINLFTSELQKRIDLFNSSAVSSNIESNRSNFNELNRIFNKYTECAIQDISLSDLYMFELEDIKEILVLIGTNDSLIDELLDRIKHDDINSYEIIKNNVTMYVKNYLSINETQNELISSKIEEYQKYIKLFEEKDYQKLFDDVNSLLQLMTSLGMENEDKWRILKFIAEKNNRAFDVDENEINILSKCNETINKYMPDELTEYHKSIINSLKNTEIDIELIPEIAASIAEKEGINKYDVQNILVGLTLSSLRENYESTHNQNSLEDIKYVLSFVVPVNVEIIMEAKGILESEREFMSNCIESGNIDFDYYQNATITELENAYNSREIAIDLKKLPILKTIEDTLDHIDKCEDSEEEYNLCCSTLVELIDAYNLVDKKKKEL